VTRPVRGFLLLRTRCTVADARADWDAWWEEAHAPDLLAATGAWAVERWRLAPADHDADPTRPAAHAGIGFTDVAFLHLPGADAAAAQAALVAAWPGLWSSRRVHEHHALDGVEAWVGHGPSGVLAPPDPARTGRILAAVQCTDPAREEAWDGWYEEQHLPDMLGSGAFTAGSRWRLLGVPALSPWCATLYDVGGCTLAEAVARSAAVMPGLVAAGRKPPWHTGGRTLTLVPVADRGPGGPAVSG